MGDYECRHDTLMHWTPKSKGHPESGPLTKPLLPSRKHPAGHYFSMISCVVPLSIGPTTCLFPLGQTTSIEVAAGASPSPK